MSKGTVFWDQPTIKTTLSSDLTASILAINASGQIVKRPAIDTSSFMSSALTNGNIFIGNASNVATGVAVTGDVTITNTGVTSLTSGVIVNSDINASAAIAVSKLAAQTASRVLVSDGSGFLSSSSVTTTTLGYLDASSSIQTQLNAKLTATITSVATGDILKYSGGNWINYPIGTNGYVLTVSGGTAVWAAPAAGNLPTGGTTGQYLNKINGTDYNAQWSTLVLAKVTDVTATFTEVNKLSGATVTTAQINYLGDVTSLIQAQLNAKQATITGGASTIVSSNLSTNIVLISDGSGKVFSSAVTATTLSYLDATSSVQNQIDSKLTKTLSNNYMLVGNGSNVASPLAPGTSGYVLTSVGGVPTWQASSANVVGSFTATYVPFAASSNTLTDDPNFYWDNTNKALYINGMRLWCDTNTNANDNIFIGKNAGNFTISGLADDNVAIGAGALQALTDGQLNVGIGQQAGGFITTGQANILIGNLTGLALTTTGGNIFIGVSSGVLATGAQNILLNAGTALTTGNYNVALGREVELQSNTADGQLTIQNIIFGTGNTAFGTSLSTGNIGIGIAAPSARLHIAASTTAAASLRIPSGTAPTSPNDGDMWYDGANVKFRLGGTTKTFTLV